MRALSGSLFLLAFVSVLLQPAIGEAKQPHPWCSTGDALRKNDPDSSTETNQIISNVCGDLNFANCCSDGEGSLRWGLACVQRAADYANRQNKLGGDYCGHYAWAQGPIRKTDGTDKRNFKQYFPRDFNIVALAGNVSALRDVEGPVAASGNVSISAFNLNYGSAEEIALLAGGRVGLYSGTVHGTLQYGTTLSSGTTVTYVDGSRPTAPTNPSLVDFASASDALVTMSESLRDNYKANGTAKYNSGALTFEGSDPELNIFKIGSDQLAGTTSYSYKVPRGSYVIINVNVVGGKQPAITNAGFSGIGSADASRTLWNFPNATSLKLQSVAFFGSILAPKASANLTNGSLRGTVVVAQAPTANIELYSAPFSLACRGGLCLDKTWSCSNDTAMANDGTAAAIASEAGFLEIEGGEYTSEGQKRFSPKHRVWYSFHPAKAGRKNKPLAVFFQGGPGGGTTPILFAFGTGPKTFNIVTDPTDPKKDTLSDLVANPNAWTEFANLLYIDAPAAGFSYPLKDADGTTPDIGNDVDRDASNFLRVLARFLTRHPALQTNRVILVGESYGGVRAALMLQYLYLHAAAGATFADTNTYIDNQMSSDLKAYFKTAFGTQTPAVAQLAKQFGHQVLIEPSVVGMDQSRAMFDIIDTDEYSDAFLSSVSCKQKLDAEHQCWETIPPSPSVPGGKQPTCDHYNCDKAKDWSSDLYIRAATNLTKAATLNQALGVDARTIAWMYADARKDAYGRVTKNIPHMIGTTSATAVLEVDAASPIDMAKSVSSGGFGTLNGDDNYLVALNRRVNTNYGYVFDSPVPPGTPSTARAYYSTDMGTILGSAFARHLNNGVKSFITVTKHDAVIWSPAIALAFEHLLSAPGSIPLSPFPLSVDYLPANPNNVSTARPGVMSVLLPAEAKSVAMPTAYESGHSVTMRAPADLRNDVMTWCKNDVMTWYTD